MTQASTKRFLLIYFLIFFGAILLRIDYFPLSWVPMYGFHRAGDGRTVVIGDREERRRGFAARRANGERLYLSALDLGVPNANFRRLYTQRAFNVGPPQDARERLALSGFNQWWYERLVGPDPRLATNYARPLLISVNRTLGYGPNDPRRIVSLAVAVRTATFTEEKMAQGDLRHPILGRQSSIITDQLTTIIRNDKILLIGPKGVPVTGEEIDD